VCHCFARGAGDLVHAGGRHRARHTARVVPGGVVGAPDRDRRRMNHAPLLTRIPGPRAAGALAGLLALLAVLWPQPAAAKSQKKLRYTYEQVWPAALRFLRVDEGFTIVEKDAEAGYVLFEVAEDGKRFRGSLEIVRIH